MNVDTAVESMRDMNKENTSNEKCEPVVDAQNFNDNEIQELINSAHVNHEADVTELFAEQYKHEIKHARKEILNDIVKPGI